MSLIINPYRFGTAPAGSTWDSTVKGSSIALSNGDLDATKTGSGYQSVYGVQGRSSGHYAFEVVVASRPTASSILIGIADKTNAATMVTSYIGNNSGPVEAAAINDSPARYFRRMTVGNNSGTAAGNQYAAGAVITVDVDIDSNTLKFFINGVQNPGFGIDITPGKTYFPAASVQLDAAVRLRTAGLSYLPSGATEWG